MIDNTKIIEIAAAIRMTGSNPDVVGKSGLHPLICVFDESRRALELSADRRKLETLHEKLNLRPIPFFTASVKGRQVADTLAETIRQTDSIPNIVAVEKVGLFALGRTGKEARRFLDNVYDMSNCQMATDQEEIMYLRLAGHVAIVTGSAQGFGKGIAEELAKEGAHVVIADLNEEKGRETCDGINERWESRMAVFCRTDVSDAQSLDACVMAAVKAFGGVDIFVANAGVLKAGALHELEPSAFELVTKINYTAYYLCARAVAPVMKLQNLYNPYHSMDIIQINSKSGLQGSNKNFAYAGSKFGAIGLTQSFAMELIDHRIKVNAICPGNFFDGPLWSDPVSGLFVQYLKAGKVPGAKTIDDVRRFYLDKVPMKRGCLPVDVARAILYAHEQEYETGQAIPVTGGQVMLS